MTVRGLVLLLLQMKDQQKEVNISIYLPEQDKRISSTVLEVVDSERFVQVRGVKGCRTKAGMASL